MSLSAKVLIGLLSGIGAGVFLGDLAAPLGVVGRAFILALQVTVLPFMAVALICGLGRLDSRTAGVIVRSGGAVLLILWAIVMTVVLAFPWSFPNWQSASFFSRSLVEAPPPVDFLDLYIPANPFSSLARGVVPAIAVFSIAVGVALMNITGKAALLDTLDVFREALDRVTGFVVKLAPYGVFALMAEAAGTLDVADLGRIQVYVLVYAGVTVVLVFWVLPALVATLTPLKFGQVIGPVRDALMTAFATGNLLVVLPILAERSKRILSDADLDEEAAGTTVDVLVPASFTIPNMGKLLSLAFVPFAGWFTGFALAPGQYPLFAAAGFASFFGQPVTSLPFLLDLLGIPAATFDLFITVDVITSRFGTLLAAAHTLVLALLAAFALRGRWRVRWPRVLAFSASSAGLLGVVIVGARLLFTYGMQPQYTGYQNFIEMTPVLGPVDANVVHPGTAPPPSPPPPGRRLDLIEQRGALRVCHFAHALPQVFRNTSAQLVGFDIEMVHLLAGELGVSLELRQIGRQEVTPRLDDGSCDLVVSGLVTTPETASSVRQSVPVMNQTLALVVLAKRRSQFATWDAIHQRPHLRVGVGPTAYFRRMMATQLPNAEVVPLASPRDFFSGDPSTMDALLTSAEAGSAWTLVYPRYSVVVPLPGRMTVPVGYAMPVAETRLAAFVDAFIRLKIGDGTTTTLFDYWYQGHGQTRQRRRWSIIRDVFGWAD